MAEATQKNKNEKKERTPIQNVIETAATVYFGFCRRAARVISNAKKKRSSD